MSWQRKLTGKRFTIVACSVADQKDVDDQSGGCSDRHESSSSVQRIPYYGIESMSLITRSPIYFDFMITSSFGP